MTEEGCGIYDEHGIDLAFPARSTRLPREVEEALPGIREDAIQAAFGAIADRLEALGYPVTGDLTPAEAAELDRQFESYVRAMALNNERIADMQDKLTYAISVLEGGVESDALATVEAADALEALSIFVRDQGYARLDEMSQAERDEVGFSPSHAGRFGTVPFENAELLAAPGEEVN